MSTNVRYPVVGVAFAALVATLIACGPSSPPTKGDTRPGQVGTSFDVTVFRPTGGTVTSKDGRIDCGTAPTATLCGPVSYAWTDTATLVATPDAGNMFGTWASDCTGRTVVDGQYTCFLDTKSSGADKYVVAVFDVAGRTDHPNFSDPAIHGLEYLKWKTGQGDTFECTYCHGTSYDGQGMAPSCNACHAKNGHPDWQNDCTFCHGAPPPPPPATLPNMTHPRVSSDIKLCWGCHQGTVDPDGNLIPGGKHLNGIPEATGGHAEGYNDPKIHGRDFFEAISTSPSDPYCTGCHGTNYELTIAAGRSCNTCHAAPVASTPPGGGWNGTDWKSNCTFCHGTRTVAYATPADLAKAAPPDAISQRLDGAPAPDRTGAHGMHLSAGPYALGYACSICHAVPAGLTHISGREARAAVVLLPPGAPAPDPNGYDAASGTCGTRCHGAARSPAWSSTGLACDGCHGVPPATPTHAGLTTGDLDLCSGCHPSTMKPDGSLDVAGGKHVNGTVDKIDGHADGFASPFVHGPAYLDHLAGVSGALNCTACHGTSLGLCTTCHSQVDVTDVDTGASLGTWQDWQTNCTFCHGTRKPVFTPDLLNMGGPPDAIAQRLDPAANEVPDRTGRHGRHLFNGGFAPAPPFQCSTCHPVPANVNHVSAARRATVTLVAANAFPALGANDLLRVEPFGSYDLSTGSCAVYCHGANFQGGTNTAVKWTYDFDQGATPVSSCTDCHGSPPLTGRTAIGTTTAPSTRYCGSAGCANHEYHRLALSNNGYASCANCHLGSAQGTVNNGLHVNGKRDVVFGPSGAMKPFTASWNSTNRTCTSSCHFKQGASTSVAW